MNRRKMVALMVAAVIVLAAVPLTGVAESEDYATRGQVCEMLLEAADDYQPGLQQSDIMKGYEDGTLREDSPVSRVEALVMLRRAFGSFPQLQGNNLRLAISKQEFTDIPDWAKAELDDVFSAGIAAGTGDGRFSPDDYVTEEQMKLFIARTYTVFGSNLKDSFYASVNKEFLDRSQIKEGRTISGTLYDLQDQVDEQVSDIIQEAVSSDPEPGSAQDKMKILYQNILNMDARNKEGWEPIKPYLTMVDEAQTMEDLMNLDDTLRRDLGSSIFTGFTLTVDSMDSNSYLLYFSTPSASLAKEVYEGEIESTKAAYLKYLKTILMLCGQEEASAQEDAQRFFDFEAKLSKASLTIAERYDMSKTYHLYSLDELDQLFPEVDLEQTFRSCGFQNRDRILVDDVGKMEAFAALFGQENIDELKNYAKIGLVASSASYFGEDFLQAAQTYQQETLGITGTESDEVIAAELVQYLMPDYLGEAYADRYCSEEIKQDVTNMIHKIINVYRGRIQKLDWMSDETKEKAILKLDTMKIKVGAPEDWSNDLDSAVIRSVADGGSYFENVVEIQKAMEKSIQALEGQQVDKTMWAMYPYTINACYMWVFNDITFPMAFLQTPIYDPNASYEENLGGLGFVIAHEITHAFDSAGSQFDENGNVANWWTEEDAQAFAGLCQDVMDYYEGLEWAPGIQIDSELTLTENIADLGAMACIVEMASEQENFDYRKMFESYAKLWITSTTREFAQSLAVLDTHSPASIRVDRVLQSVDQFYETYGIEPGDGMYLPPSERVKVW